MNTAKMKNNERLVKRHFSKKWSKLAGKKSDHKIKENVVCDFVEDNPFQSILIPVAKGVTLGVAFKKQN